MPGLCPICGAEHAACGGPWIGTAIDIVPTEVDDMEEDRSISRYQDADGNTFRMTAADARRRGFTPVGSERPTTDAILSAPTMEFVEAAPVAPLGKYQDADGNLFSMTPEDAQRYGYTPAGETASSGEAGEAPAEASAPPGTEGKALTGPPEDKAVAGPEETKAPASRTASR